MNVNRMLRILAVVAIASSFSWTQTSTPSEKVPVIQGGAGPCSMELTVLGADGKPAYAATVKVHIAYGFGGMHRLDLEAGTNVDGKVSFTGLPRRVSHPPLEFHASKDEFAVVASYDPSVECQSKRDISLEKLKAADAK
jgi:hypothetical protein